MDAFERHFRAGLELLDVPVDDVDVAVARAADSVYGPHLRALAEADLSADWAEADLDPGRAPTGHEPPARSREGTAGAQSAHGQVPPGWAPGTHPQDLSLSEQAALVASGGLDPTELLSATLERIAARNGELNAIVDTFAEESERMLSEAPEGPLHGVPVAVKDQFALPWRGPLDGTDSESIPAGESAIHRRLRAAGAIVPGITHMAFWGASTTGHMAAYGPVRNPWNPEHCAGGSSGGSASAVAGRLVAGAVGADGGGSIRLPAAYCGITGLKPTFGAIPPEGNVHGYLSLDAAGPMCRDAADARLLGEALLARELPRGDGSGLRVGIVRNPFWENLDPAAEGACRELLDAAGWETEEVEIRGAEHALAATVLRITLEGAPSLDADDLAAADPLMRALAKFQMLLPGQALVRADRVRTVLRRALAEALGRVDVLAWPTVPAPAPRVDNPTVELPGGPAPADAANVRQAGIANLAGTPAISIPAGLHPNGLPLGLMLLGRWGDEALLLDGADHVERVTERAHVDAVPPVAARATA